MAESALATPEARSLIKLGKDRRLRLEQIRDNFKEKGSFGLRWDSKVSEDEKKSWWYLYLFTLQSSNKTEVIKELESCIKMYENIEKLETLTFDEIDKMDEDVKNAIKLAKTKIRSTNSSTVYKMCNELVSSKIDAKIEKIKNALGSQEYKKLRNNFEKLVKEESEIWKQQYQTQINELKEENEAQAAHYKEKSDKFEKDIAEANSRMECMGAALMKLLEYTAKKDSEFAAELQNMFLENPSPVVITSSRPVIALGYEIQPAIEDSKKVEKGFDPDSVHDKKIL